MADIVLLLFGAIGGGIVIFFGTIILVGRRIFEPSKEWREKVERLEREVEDLKK